MKENTLNAFREKLRSEPWSPAAWHQASEMSCRGDSAHSVWKHLALGIQVRFTCKRSPTDHAIIERTHQTMTAQALLGQTYPSHADLWAGLDERREVLNRHLPSRALTYKAPLEAYPQAVHLERLYRPKWEEAFLSLEKVCRYLAQGRWFRSIRSNGFFGLGSYQYYLGKPFAQRSVAIGFDPDTMTLICQPEGSEQTFRLPAQGLTKAELMGELAALQALPIYQLALPFSLEYAHHLTGTTLGDFPANRWVRLYETQQRPKLMVEQR